MNLFSTNVTIYNKLPKINITKRANVFIKCYVCVSVSAWYFKYNVILMNKKCIICGSDFEAKRADAEVCSAACRQKNWRNKKDGKTIEIPQETQQKPIIFSGPQILPEWAKKIEEYCNSTGITSAELIECHRHSKIGITKEKSVEKSLDQPESCSFAVKGMSRYDLERRKKKSGF